MKRKTNLFYTSGQDSKFITFSNYTESLTGNFLSTDTKLYPSRFLALYIKGLNSKSKKHLIKYLAKYYETKLAVLRDHFNDMRKSAEDNIYPLNYLLEALLRITKLDENGIEFNHKINNDEFDTITNNVKFKYVSDIIEQDYNGTFTDTICTIDLNKYTYVDSIIFNTDSDNDVNDSVVTFECPAYLYGWGNKIAKEYENSRTIPDSICSLDLDEVSLYFHEIAPEEPATPDDKDYQEDDTPSGTHEVVVEEPEEDTEYEQTPVSVTPGTVRGLSGGGSFVPAFDPSDSVTDNVNNNRSGVYDPTNEEFADQNMNQAIYNYIVNNDDIVDLSSIDGMYNENGTINKDEFEKYLKEHANDLISNNGFIILVGQYDDNDNDITLYRYDGTEVEEMSVKENYQYFVNSQIAGLILSDKMNIDNQNSFELEFNCIIPLYDIVDINYKSNFNEISTMTELDLSMNNTDTYITNVPLGMWFFTDGKENDENTTSIKLYKDLDSGFAQSWSLTISSQFKPFPYSMNMPSDMGSNEQAGAYSTFSQVLSAQSEMINRFNAMLEKFESINDHVKNIESQLANIGTSYNIDNIHRELNNYEIQMTNKFNTLKGDIFTYLNNLRWNVTI